MTNVEPQYKELCTALRETALLASCESVLGWDEQVNLPPKGGEHRAEQMALLSGLVHERSTAPRIGELLADLETADLGDADNPRAANVREARRRYDRATKLPKALVEELSRITTLSQQAWVGARREADFKAFLPWLEKVVALKREQAQALASGNGALYDALLDEYEPGATSERIKSVFDPLRTELVDLLAAIRDSNREPDVGILTRSYAVPAQREFSTAAAAAIGFDFDAGRLDVAAHPFCSGFGPGDCRLTTRYDEHHFPGAFFGTLHEAGHGIYEQGLNKEAFGTAMGETCSLGIHESQSRLWENFVGRSRGFWQHFFSRAVEKFPEALSGVGLDDFYAAINDVRPTMIRVEADEVTYNLHIMLRFDLEKQLIAGDLEPADVREAWNTRFKNDFGITPPDDAQGCLQDIHWSAGLIGYFPTYCLGNMYAAQFFVAAQRELGGLAEQFAAGEFTPLRDWLRREIHERGLQYRAERLVEVVTGEKLSHEPLVAHLRGKFGPLYEL